jgi:hypothetical protein
MSEFTYNFTGYTAGTGYGYVMVSTSYYAPYYYIGTIKGYTCGFTP